MDQNNFISSGIPNYGNTCYINSALQMLISIKECRDYILNFDTNDLKIVNCINIIKNLKRIFKLIIKKANLGHKIIININKNKNTKNYKIYMFLDLITNFLSMELLHKSEINKSLINKIFILNKISIKNQNLFFIF